MTSQPGLAPEALQLLGIRLAIQDFFSRYIDCLNAGRFEDWPGFFTEHGVYKVLDRENVERDLPIATWSCLSRAMMQDRVVAIRNASVFSPRYLRRVAGGALVTREPSGVCTVRASFCAFETQQDELTRVFMVGEYRGRIVLAPEGPRFEELLVVYDTSLIPGLLVFPV